MMKNKAVRVLAVVSTAFCALFVICIFAFIAFSGSFIKLYIDDEAVTSVKMVPSGYIIRLICTSAIILLNARLLLGRGVSSNLYGAYAAAALMVIGVPVSDIVYSINYENIQKLLAFTAMRNLADWVQPLLSAGTVMTIVSCAADVHINKRRSFSAGAVKTGIALTAAYSVLFLLVIIFQKKYTGADVLIFPMSCMVEFVMAMCMIIASVFILNGAEPALPLTVSAGALIAGGFAEAPMNFAYTYFLSHFMGVNELAALGTVSAYAGYVSYLFFAGAAVTIVCSTAYAVDKKVTSSDKKGRIK